MPQKRTNGREPAKSRPRSDDEAVKPAPGSELIVVAHPDAGLRVSRSGIGAGAADVAPLTGLLDDAQADLKPLFGASEERLQYEASILPAAQRGEDVPDLSVYYRAEAPHEELETLARELASLETVETAYIKPPAEPAATATEPETEGVDHLNTMVPTAAEPPIITPDFTPRQGYLDAAPGGVDARWAWTQPGGRGTNVRIIDIEGAWRFTHEDLLGNQGGVMGGIETGDLGWRNHGTAVVGVFGGDVNPRGVTGISPDANTRAISCFGVLGIWVGSSGPIRDAANALSAGDIILIELHRPGPRFNYAARDDQMGYIAIEWWPDDLDAIRYAVGRGVIVIEAAGNGSQNLDDPLYDTGPGGVFGFPASWRNPFRRNPIDSGAILVGAGAPPSGTHGLTWGPDRSRLGFSNFGAAIDAQGWGAGVTTTGYGDLQGGSNENEWYTDGFSGTSSASPVVVGSVASVQGNLRARGLTRLTPAAARSLLRTTGSPQQDAVGRPATQRIGNRPNIRQMIERFSTVSTAPLYRYWNAGAGDHFYTTNWSELGWGNYGWQFERTQCHIWSSQRPGAVPLYRYWNASATDHFYTTDWNELGWGNHGWQFERIQGYVSPTQQAGSVPLYRYWNPTIADHFYTIDWAELGPGKYGWQFERVQCYVQAQATTVQGPAAPGGAGASIDASVGTPSSNGHESTSDAIVPGLEYLATAQPAPEEPPPSGGATGGFAPFDSAGEERPASFMSAGAAGASSSSFETAGSPQETPAQSFTVASKGEPGTAGTGRAARTRITIDVDPGTD